MLIVCVYVNTHNCAHLCVQNITFFFLFTLIISGYRSKFKIWNTSRLVEQYFYGSLKFHGHHSLINYVRRLCHLIGYLESSASLASLLHLCPPYTTKGKWAGNSWRSGVKLFCHSIAECRNELPGKMRWVRWASC